MATIRKRGDTWQVQVRRQGRTVSKSFLRRADAARWANQLEVSIDQSGLPSDTGSLKRLRVADIIERFRDKVCPKRRGGKNETYVLNALLRDPVVTTRLCDLRSEMFGDYRDRRLKSVAPGTVIRELGLVQHIFEFARTEWSIPVANPVKPIKKPKPPKHRERRLNAGELEKLLNACQQSRNKYLSPMLRLAVATGMRRSELVRLKWRDINYNDCTLHIPLTKTDEPRTIPLSSQARLVLLDVALHWTEGDNVFPTTSEAVKLAWKRLTQRAGINGLHFHDLRHEAVTSFFERGLSVPEVALISGHKDPRMLFRYTHLRAKDVASKLQ